MALRGRDIDHDGRTLVERLGGHWTSNGGLCHCPAHDDRSPSLSIRPGRTRLLLHCFAGCTADQVLRALETLDFLTPGANSYPGAATPLHSGSDQISSTNAERIWAAGRRIEGSAAATYLAQRGLESASPELRYNPQTPHGPAPLTSFRPALIAAVRDDCGLRAIHRTFVDFPDGDVVRDQRRAGLGRFGNGAVRLGGIGPRLGLAEGIETALSAGLLFGMPCWATLGSERFRQVSIPALVEELHLFLDHDSGGARAELLAREAHPSMLIKVHVPPRPGDDWNDVLRATRHALVGQ